jgi:hypothetical protein
LRVRGRVGLLLVRRNWSICHSKIPFGRYMKSIFQVHFRVGA